MHIADLIHKAMEHADIPSQRQLAERLGVSHTIIGQWAAGERHPSFEAAAALADLAGLPLHQTAAEIRMQTPEGAKHRGLLRRIAQSAAGVALGLLFTATPHHAEAGSIEHKLDSLCILHLLTSWLRRIFGGSHDLDDWRNQHGQAALC